MKSRESRGSTQSRRKVERAVEDDPGVLMDNDINPMVFRCMDCCLNPTDKFHVFRRHISFYHTKPNSSLAEDTEVERKGSSTPTLQCTICLTGTKTLRIEKCASFGEHCTSIQNNKKVPLPFLRVIFLLYIY